MGLGSFTLEDYQDAPEEVRAVLEKLLPDLRRLKTGVDGALSNGISITENLNAKIKQVNVATLAEWQRPTYSNSWVDFSGSIIGRYQKLPSGLVVSSGAIKSGTLNTVAFTVPAAYRPDQDVNLAAESNGYGKMRIEADGDVVPVAGDNSIFSLDGAWMAADRTPPVAITPLKLSSEVKGAAAKGVLVLQAYLAGRPDLVAPAPALAWSNVGDGNVLLSNAVGLAPAKTYTLTLLILGG